MAGADAAGRGDHQRAERGDGVLILRLFGHDMDRLAEQAELDKLRAGGKVQARDNQERRHPRGIEPAADCVDYFVNGINHFFNSLFPQKNCGGRRQQPAQLLFYLKNARIATSICKFVKNPQKLPDRLQARHVFHGRSTAQTSVRYAGRRVRSPQRSFQPQRAPTAAPTSQPSDSSE